jgi:hypothetical protein
MEHLNWLWLPFVPAILVLAHAASKKKSDRVRQFTLSVLLATSTAWVALSAMTAWRNSVAPREFDFQLYWIYGSTIYDGHSPYDVNALKRAAEPLNPGADMMAELLFLQTPPSALLYGPLGAFDIRTACVLWYAFQAVVIGCVIRLLSRTFFPDDGIRGTLLCTTLLLSMLPARDTIWLAQTNFLILLMLLLFWRSSRQMKGGVALGVGILIKPILALYPIYLFLTRQWKAFSGVVAAGAGLSVITIAVFGPGMYFGYFFDNPIAHQMPVTLYSEGINQSLLATILRVAGAEIDSGHAAVTPAFVTLAIVLSIVSGWLVRRTLHNDDKLSLAIVLTLSLLLFPKTLSHYSVLLIVPLLFLWSRRETVPGGATATASLITAVFALCAADMAFAANLCSWSFVCITALQARSPATSVGRNLQAELSREVALAGSGV